MEAAALSALFNNTRQASSLKQVSSKKKTTSIFPQHVMTSQQLWKLHKKIIKMVSMYNLEDTIELLQTNWCFLQLRCLHPLDEKWICKQDLFTNSNLFTNYNVIYLNEENFQNNMRKWKLILLKHGINLCPSRTGQSKLYSLFCTTHLHILFFKCMVWYRQVSMQHEKTLVQLIICHLILDHNYV